MAGVNPFSSSTPSNTASATPTGEEHPNSSNLGDTPYGIELVVDESARPISILYPGESENVINLDLDKEDLANLGKKPRTEIRKKRVSRRQFKRHAKSMKAQKAYAAQANVEEQIDDEDDEDFVCPPVNQGISKGMNTADAMEAMGATMAQWKKVIKQDNQRKRKAGEEGTSKSSQKKISQKRKASVDESNVQGEKVFTEKETGVPEIVEQENVVESESVVEEAGEVVRESVKNTGVSEGEQPQEEEVVPTVHVLVVMDQSEEGPSNVVDQADASSIPVGAEVGEESTPCATPADELMGNMAEDTPIHIGVDISEVLTPEVTPCTGKETNPEKPAPVSPVVASRSTSEESDSDSESDFAEKALSKSFYNKNIKDDWESFHLRGFTYEKVINTEAFKLYGVFDFLVDRGWISTVQTVVGYSKTLVREFYCNVPRSVNVEGSKKWGRVFCRGKVLEFTPEKINALFGMENVVEGELMVDMDEVIKAITSGKHQRWKAKLPSACLLYRLLQRMPVNFGQMVLNHVGNLKDKGAKVNLPFPSLIYKFLSANGIKKDAKEKRTAGPEKMGISKVLLSGERVCDLPWIAPNADRSEPREGVHTEEDTTAVLSKKALAVQLNMVNRHIKELQEHRDLPIVALSSQ